MEGLYNSSEICKNAEGISGWCGTGNRRYVWKTLLSLKPTQPDSEYLEEDKWLDGYMEGLLLLNNCCCDSALNTFEKNPSPRISSPIFTVIKRAHKSKTSKVYNERAIWKLFFSVWDVTINYAKYLIYNFTHYVAISLPWKQGDNVEELLLSIL